jgi:hypothetical protein
MEEPLLDNLRTCLGCPRRAKLGRLLSPAGLGFTEGNFFE